MHASVVIPIGFRYNNIVQMTFHRYFSRKMRYGGSVRNRNEGYLWKKLQ